MSFGSFKYVTNKLYVYKTYIKQDLALNNLHVLTYYNTKPTNQKSFILWKINRVFWKNY